jgi:hypothetical protein
VGIASFAEYRFYEVGYGGSEFKSDSQESADNDLKQHTSRAGINISESIDWKKRTNQKKPQRFVFHWISSG